MPKIIKYLLIVGVGGYLFFRLTQDMKGYEILGFVILLSVLIPAVIAMARAITKAGTQEQKQERIKKIHEENQAKLRDAK